MLWTDGTIVTKDPDAVIDWRWDWYDWLGEGDYIVSVLVAISGGAGDITDESATIVPVTHHGVEKSGAGVDVLLSGGTAGHTYAVRVQITTAAGLVDDRTVNFEVAEQ